jgi:hypothetical protein
LNDFRFWHKADLWAGLTMSAVEGGTDINSNRAEVVDGAEGTFD